MSINLYLMCFIVLPSIASKLEWRHYFKCHRLITDNFISYSADQHLWLCYNAFGVARTKSCLSNVFHVKTEWHFNTNSHVYFNLWKCVVLMKTLLSGYEDTQRLATWRPLVNDTWISQPPERNTKIQWKTNKTSNHTFIAMYKWKVQLYVKRIFAEIKQRWMFQIFML